MNKQLFKKLCLNYGKDPNKDLYELWSNELRPYDEEELEKAISIIVANDKFFPTLSRVLEVVKEVVKNEVIDFNSEASVRKKMERLNIHPDWLDKEIENEPMDEETQKEFDDFQEFLEEFRNS